MASIDDVVILCGGRGTRLQEHTPSIPKPLVEIGGEPILWHVIQIYAAHGLRRFILCTGYKGELIEQAVTLGRVARRRGVRCVDTGVDTPTGGRLATVAPLLAGALVLRHLRRRRGRHRPGAAGRLPPPRTAAWPR